MATAEKTNVYGKLSAIQKELKAPKGQFNSFGKYHYRSCEDILESIKPLLSKYKATLFISDSLELIGTRFYVMATATFTDVESGESVKSSAFARESEEKKGMDSSQVTGATSSYARKYALNGLFLIDDTKDADCDEYTEQQNNAQKQTSRTKANFKTDEQKNQEMIDNTDKSLIPEQNAMISPEQLAKINSELERTGVSLQQILKAAKVDALEKMSQVTAVSIINRLAKSHDKE